MSNTTEDIIARAAEAGVSVDEYLAGVSEWNRQEDEAWAAKADDEEAER